ncbi:MAG: DUF2071 domain-containing protein [Bryobacterales bacterium]|nr:DUF2071 domain-containing protein [Bryobacterales bacterium]
MINYEVPPDVLAPLVPRGVTLDTFEGRTLVSMVGFLFENTRVLGVPPPFHQNFEEVNLRFYVRHAAANEIRRGVVFVKELVPKFMIAWVARNVYNENYEALPMRHTVDPGQRARYEWEFAGRWNALEVTTGGDAYVSTPGSEEEFITEHYWGYTAQRDGGAIQYQVEHPKWKVWRAANARFDCDVAAVYGSQFAPYLNKEPSSAFLAEGSDVVVYEGTTLPAA